LTAVGVDLYTYCSYYTTKAITRSFFIEDTLNGQLACLLQNGWMFNRYH
jgi:hypothetical protein